jgi:transcriptional regulator with XRE-family HTH domain
MSRVELSTLAKCSSVLIQQWEEMRARPTRERLARMCSVLGVSFDDIAQGEVLPKSKASKHDTETRFTRERYQAENVAAYGDELRAAVAASGLSQVQAATEARLHPARVKMLVKGHHKPNYRDAQALRVTLNAPGLWPHVTESTHMGRPKTRKRDDPRPDIERGTVWRRKGRAVMVEYDASRGDTVYFRVLGKASTGELMQCSASTFLERYAVA